MKCVVTGGAGFIGSNLVDRLIGEGHEVLILDDLSTGKEENINPKARYHGFDIASDNILPNIKILGLFDGVDVVFHLACLARVQPSIENPLLYHDKNVNGLVNMLEACRIYGVKRFVFSSSSSVYGDAEQLPTTEECSLNSMSPYALHKFIGEQYCKLYSELYDIETVCLRYFNVYGERQLLEGAYCLVMGKFAQQKLNGKPMTIRGDGEQRRDFTYVGDVVDANVKCMDYPLELNGDVFNIGNGDNRSVNQIADLIGGDRVNINPVIEPKETLADNKKAHRVLGWETTTKIEDWITKYKEEIGL
jgi:UDP-glucose 4-epimerase